MLQLTHSGHIFAVYAAANQKKSYLWSKHHCPAEDQQRTTMSDKPKADAAKTDAKKPAV